MSDAAATVPGVTAVSTVYQGAFEVRHSLSNVTAVSTDHLSSTVILRMDSGDGAPALAAGELLIDTTTASSNHLSVGSVVPVKFAQTGSSTMRIGGIFQPNALIGSYVVGDRFFLAHYDNPLPVAVLVQTKTGTRPRPTRSTAAGRRTRTSRSRPGHSTRSRNRHRSTSYSALSTPCWPWRWSSPSSASSTP